MLVTSSYLKGYFVTKRLVEVADVAKVFETHMTATFEDGIMHLEKVDPFKAES